MTRAYLGHAWFISAHLNPTTGDADLWTPQLIAHETVGQLLNSVDEFCYTRDNICACVCKELHICNLHMDVKGSYSLWAWIHRYTACQAKAHPESILPSRNSSCWPFVLMYKTLLLWFREYSARIICSWQRPFENRHFELAGTSNRHFELRISKKIGRMFTLQDHISGIKLLDNLGIIIIYMKE